jgi:undecaprenyl-diphosphatase
MARRGTIFCAKWLIYLLYGDVLLTIWRQRHTLPLARVVRASLLVGGAATLGKVLSRCIDAPRPFVANGVPPLLPVGADEGFPSTHAIQATALTAAVWELRDGHVRPMAAGALLVMLGRLGANVHHTRDVLGGVGISLMMTAAVRRLPLPRRWERPLLAAPNRVDSPDGAVSRRTDSAPLRRI